MATRPTKNINILVYKDQYDFITTYGLGLSETYREAWDIIYGNENSLLKEKRECLERAKQIDDILEKEKNRMFSTEEINFLRESIAVVKSNQEQKINIRFKTFQKFFGRYYMSLEEFKQKTLEMEKII